MAIISGVSPQGISRGYLWGYLQQNIGVPPQGIFGGISDGVYPGVSPWGSLWVFPEGMLYYMHFRGNEII